MTSHPPADHFEGKSVVDHLREARTRGAIAAAEVHGVEMPGHLAAGADAAKDTAIALLILWAFFGNAFNYKLLIVFSSGWMLWKIGRSAFLGWSRLERLHRVIEEERWEIEHHREQEREELTEMYMAKGLSGKFLEEVIDVLMADDNRLLRVMLEEELGLTLEAYEHPLKQSFGAGAGVLLTALLFLLCFWINPFYGILAATLIMICVVSATAAKLERNHVLPAIIWSLGIAVLTGSTVFLLARLF